MRILGISGSPRGLRSNTRRLVERVLEGAKSAGADVELVDLSGIDIAYCIACDLCHVKGTCSRVDEFGPLHAKMLDSDGLVFGSPVYFSAVTAQLKTLIDRLPQDIHCQTFLGTYACSVATAGSPETEETLAYMNNVLVRLGCTAVGSVGSAVAVPDSMLAAEQDAVAMGKDLVKAIQEQRRYPEQDAVHALMHERFKRLVTFRKDEWKYEYEYWDSKDWL
jgi:multimeric flavodoxin WrbA